jgi:hypothetical protein
MGRVPRLAVEHSSPGLMTEGGSAALRPLGGQICRVSKSPQAAHTRKAALRALGFRGFRGFNSFRHQIPLEFPQ